MHRQLKSKCLFFYKILIFLKKYLLILTALQAEINEEPRSPPFSSKPFSFNKSTRQGSPPPSPLSRHMYAKLNFFWMAPQGFVIMRGEQAILPGYQNGCKVQWISVNLTEEKGRHVDFSRKCFLPRVAKQKCWHCVFRYFSF